MLTPKTNLAHCRTTTLITAAARGYDIAAAPTRQIYSARMDCQIAMIDADSTDTEKARAKRAFAVLMAEEIARAEADVTALRNEQHRWNARS